jgi:hypothetical protein
MVKPSASQNNSVGTDIMGSRTYRSTQTA